jgi:hypothetical protein
MRPALGALACFVLMLAACEKRDPPMTAKLAAPYPKHPMYRIIETPPESPYEAALDDALRVSIAPDAMHQICAQWYPAHGSDVADAFLAWRARNKAVLDELMARSTEVWNRRAGPDIAYVKMVYPHIRKDVVNALMRRSDTVSVQEFEATCARYPDDVKGSKWNLEKRLGKELQVIRERPLTRGANAA